MRYSIELGTRARSDELALEIERRIRRNLERGAGRSFERMWGTIVLVCRHDDASLALPRPPRSTLTLRFDYGRLSVQEGRVGRPDVTLWGTASEILGLGVPRSEERAPFERVWGRGRALGRVLRPGDLRVFGRLAHPRLVARFALLLGE